MKRLMDIGYYFRVMQFDRCGYLAEEQSQFQSRISSDVFCLKYGHLAALYVCAPFELQDFLLYLDVAEVTSPWRSRWQGMLA